MEDGGTMALTERQLEIAIAVMACVPLWYLSSGGHNVFPAKIFLLILECFAAMFMTIFLITRWVATKEVRPLGVAGTFLTLTSLWMLIEDLRR
jgi:hypothetical protein